MYFIYKKQINVASEYSYNVDSIVEWFKGYIDQDDIIEAYGGVEEVTAKDIVDDIFCESDSWYDDFYYYLEEYFRKKDIEYNEDINDQLLDLLCDSIFKYLNLL
jgi:hypothetical protein